MGSWRGLGVNTVRFGYQGLEFQRLFGCESCVRPGRAIASFCLGFTLERSQSEQYWVRRLPSMDDCIVQS